MIPAKYRAKKARERELARGKRVNRAQVRENRDYKLKSELSKNWEETPEGFLIVPVVIAKKMVLDYPEFGSKELLGEDIFSKEYLASCDGCAFVLDHPVTDDGKPTDVLPDNFEQFVKGVLYDPKVEREKDRVVGKLKIWAPEVIESIKNGELRELSQGYSCNVIDNAGRYDGQPYTGVQTQMVMNHLALVSAGRAGDEVTVLNSLQRQELRKEFERIDRRRENMKIKNGRANMDEQTTEAGKPNPQNQEAEPKNEDQGAEDSRFKAIEDKLEILAQALAKLTGTANADPAIETEPQQEEKENGETPKPDDKANAEKDEENKMNKVTNAVLKKVPAIVQATIAAQTDAYMQAQTLIGEDVQDFAPRLNDIHGFRKSVLIRNGLPQAEVNRMSEVEAAVWLKVRADQAKTEMLKPRYNGATNYTDGGDRKAVANSEF